MKGSIIYIFPVAVLLMLFLSGSCFALSGYEYITPDSWSKHTTPNGVKAYSGNIDLGDGATLNAALATRYHLRASYYTDSDLYRYFRIYTKEMKLGDGTVDMNLNMRIGGDFNNRRERGVYDYFWNSMDVSKKGSDVDFRLYQGNIVFKDVIKHTKITLGRFYLNYVDSLKIDGGVMRMGTEDYSAYVFYGLPVSFYTKGLNSQAMGGGLDLKFKTDTRLRVDGKYLVQDGNVSYGTYLIKARVDQKIKAGNKAEMNVHLDGAVMNDVWFASGGLLGKVKPSQTTFNLWVQSQLNANDRYVNPIVSDYNLILGHQAPYVMFGLKIFQGIWKYFAVGAAFEAKFNQKQNYGQRDYWRVSGNFDFFGVIPNNYISFIVDYWNVERFGRQSANKQVFFGGRFTQVVLNNLDIWLGANLTNYRTHFQQIDLDPGAAPINYFNKKLDDNVYVVYAGASWSPLKWINVQVDYMYEASELMAYEDPNNSKSHNVELWLNFLY